MDVKIRAERDRLLSDANVARLRGDFAAMEKACRDVITLTGEDAEIVELLGDALRGQGKLEEARDCYRKSADLEQGRATAETRYARVVLELAEAERQLQSTLADLERPSMHIHPKSHAGSAILSMLFPGLGQLINGDYVKGGIVAGAFIISLIIILILPDSREFARQLSGSLGMAGRAGGVSTGYRIGLLFPFFAGVALFCYVYSVIDALTEATKRIASKSEPTQ